MATYLVTTPDGKERLVEAANQAGARNHVSRDTITVAVAKSADLFRVAKAGGEIEQAGEAVPEPEPEPEPQQESAGEPGEGMPPGGVIVEARKPRGK